MIHKKLNMFKISTSLRTGNENKKIQHQYYIIKMFLPLKWSKEKMQGIKAENETSNMCLTL